VFTDEVLEDSAVDLVSYTASLFAEEIAKEEDRVFLTGSTLASDPFNGVLNAADVATYALPATKLVADITADDLNKAIYSLTQAQRMGASWYMSSEVFGVVQRLKTEDGHYLVQQPTGGAPATIWGYPVVISDVLPGLTNEGAAWDALTPFMFFANLSQTSVYGDKGGIAVKMLYEATLTDADGDTINLAQNDMTAIRVVKRTGYVNVLPEGILVLTTGSAT
jgi:HK97 family phage major capsid protein